MRLYGGYSRADGAAEVCINGLWANICYRNWDETDSIVFCKQLLGHENIGTYISDKLVHLDYSLTQSSNLIGQLNYVYLYPHALESMHLRV